MHLVAQGLTNKEIAASLNLSEFTVENHIRRVMRQMEAESRHESRRPDSRDWSLGCAVVDESP
jgi:DNA-binding NarL/FixJ family response regulator